MHIRKFHISKHAAKRMAQRNLDIGDIALVLQFGRIEYRAGAEFYFLGKRNVPDGMDCALKRLVGTTVVISGGEIVTVYRNRRALSAIKRKLKRFSPPVIYSHLMAGTSAAEESAEGGGWKGEQGIPLFRLPPPALCLPPL